MSTAELLESRGVNPTAMRMIVWDYLSPQHHALSLTDIELGIETGDRVTIYRTLKTFESKGLVHSIDDGTGVSKYAICSEICTPAGHADLHPHFFCIRCEETLCLPRTRIPEIPLPKGFQASDQELILRGICANCNRI